MIELLIFNGIVQSTTTPAKINGRRSTYPNGVLSKHHLCMRCGASFVSFFRVTRARLITYVSLFVLSTLVQRKIQRERIRHFDSIRCEETRVLSRRVSSYVPGRGGIFIAFIFILREKKQYKRKREKKRKKNP